MGKARHKTAGLFLFGIPVSYYLLLDKSFCNHFASDDVHEIKTWS